jgi:outer membrane protein OmpA-like peptidoglycan-associated protein
MKGEANPCAGTPVNLSLTANNPFAVRYQWTVNGTASGGNQPTLTFNAPDAGGMQQVAVQISDATGRTPASPTVTRNIAVPTRAYVRPTVKGALTGAGDLQQGQSTIVTAEGQGECGGPLTYTWSAAEGTITPDAANPQRAIFNSTNVAFSPAVDRDEVKQVTVTATVRDGRGTTANGPIVITVRRPAQAVRMPDILFTAGSARVNNCGKRILLEEVFPRVRTGNFTVYLVGHRDGRETTANLDRDRAYNAARVLVTGADTQVRLEPERVRADWVGNNQTAAPQPGFCGTSTRPSTEEVAGATIREADAGAANRRVEVWLVPTGVALPPSAVNARPLPNTIRPPK